jgi:hypothetical protein
MPSVQRAQENCRCYASDTRQSRIQRLMKTDEAGVRRLRRLSRLVEAICGMYSRVGKRLRRDRSFVSRVARGVRQSEEVERELLAEVDRIERQEFGQ